MNMAERPVPTASPLQQITTNEPGMHPDFSDQTDSNTVNTRLTEENWETVHQN